MSLPCRHVYILMVSLFSNSTSTANLFSSYLINFRFDEMRQGEPARKIHGKKRAFRDNNDVATHDMVSDFF